MKRKHENWQQKEKEKGSIPIVVVENIESAIGAHVVEETNEEKVCAMHVVDNTPKKSAEEIFPIEYWIVVETSLVVVELHGDDITVEIIMKNMLIRKWYAYGLSISSTQILCRNKIDSLQTH